MKKKTKKIRKKVYRGWIRPDTEHDLPTNRTKYDAERVVRFGETPFFENDKRCRITVEWEE